MKFSGQTVGSPLRGSSVSWYSLGPKRHTNQPLFKTGFHNIFTLQFPFIHIHICLQLQHMENQYQANSQVRQLINAIVSPTLTSSQVYMPPPVRWRLSRLKLWCLMGALSQSSAVPSLRRRNSSAWRPHTEKSLTEPKMLPGLLNRWTPGKLWQGASLTIYSAVIALLNSV